MRIALRTALLVAIAAIGTSLARGQCGVPSASAVWSVATSRDGMRVYADGVPNGGGSYFDCFYRSDDAGRTWSSTLLGEVAWILSIDVDPRDADDVWVASQQPTACADPCFPPPPGGLYHSTDGGATWARNQSFLYARSILRDPVNPDMLFLSDYTGSFKSGDSGVTWNPIALLQGGAVLSSDPLAPNALFAATGQDLFRSTDSGESWSGSLLGGYGGPYPFTRVVAVSSDLFVGTYSGVYRSSDAGDHWDLSGHLGDEIVDLFVADGVLFSTGFWPGGPASGGMLSRSDDRGVSWSLVRRSPEFPSFLAWSAPTSSLIVGTFTEGVRLLPIEDTVISFDFPVRPAPAPVSGR
jgi:hypothetical protein